MTPSKDVAVVFGTRPEIISSPRSSAGSATVR